MSSIGSGSDEKRLRLVTDSPEELSEAGDNVLEHYDELPSPGESANGHGDVNHNDVGTSNGYATHGMAHYHETDDYDDGEDGMGDDEDEEEEDEDEEEEPALKYERLGGPVHDLLHKDTASALAYSNKRLVRRAPCSAVST